MFDLITGHVTHAPRPRTGPVVVSIAVHAAVVGAVLIGTLIAVKAPVPTLPMMMAFVASPPPPPPPPPPAAPAPQKRQVEPQQPAAADVAPIAPPSAIEPEAPMVDLGEGEVEGGVEGGIPGGVPGEVLGGLISEAPPPPPPPPPPAPRKPVRVGGQIKEPTLVHSVEPVYPPLALARGLEGVVILEAIVDQEGRVESVQVLRSPGVFEQAALDAVRQWRYSPVILNGRPEKFILTVVVSFHLGK